MIYADMTCRKFVEETASKAPVPGGGSVSALVGAVGAALGHMVGSLTLGKKKYADVEDDVRKLMEDSRAVQAELMELIQKDTETFEPLSKLYGMKAETDEEKDEKEALMEEALLNCSQVPLQIMEACGRAIELSGQFADKGSRLALSDAGSSAIICKAALQAASLNVYINTKSMKNRDKAQEIEQICAMHLMNFTTLADGVFEFVADQLRSSDRKGKC